MTDSIGDEDLLPQQVRLAEVAKRYYLDNASKVEIAAQLGLSRFQVARMLDEARRTGVVRIEVRDPRLPRSGREVELAATLGLSSVRIVQPVDGDGLSAVERLGAVVLRQLVQTIRSNPVIGVSWSRTLDTAARFLPALPPCNLVQLTGASYLQGSGAFTRMLLQLGGRGGVTTYPLYAPFIVDRRATADDIRRQPVVAETLSRADSLETAVVSIGGWVETGSTVWTEVSDDDRAACTAAGAVAEISGNFIAADGAVLSTPLDGRVIGVSIGQLRRTPHVTGYAYGVERVSAVLAAVRTGVFDSLVLEDALADAVLAASTGG
ncbi:sugar-binding transcriptional regulator [uncultured Amnibacterium sp.]|uniref:sugar-binding transcriptional regulator n=1 Tax=uncultured Amnibacterium sp. TaxID=1631851 RepID=UPI0035CBA272